MVRNSGTDMSDDVELRRLAIRRADMKLAFRSHFMAYVVVNAGLIAIYFMTSDFGDYFWPLWPMLGMSIAVLVALWRAFGPMPQAGAVAPESRAPEPM